MKTLITELFGIRYPILLSGMSWISVPAMVAMAGAAERRLAGHVGTPCCKVSPHGTGIL